MAEWQDPETAFDETISSLGYLFSEDSELERLKKRKEKILKTTKYPTQTTAAFRLLENTSLNYRQIAIIVSDIKPKKYISPQQVSQWHRQYTGKMSLPSKPSYRKYQEEVKFDLWEGVLNLRQIAKKHGIPVKEVKKMAQEAKLLDRPKIKIDRSLTQRAKAQEHLTEDIKFDLWEGILSIQQIAKKYQVKWPFVAKIAKKSGIKDKFKIMKAEPLPEPESIAESELEEPKAIKIQPLNEVQYHQLLLERVYQRIDRLRLKDLRSQAEDIAQQGFFAYLQAKERYPEGDRRREKAGKLAVDRLIEQAAHKVKQTKHALKRRASEISFIEPSPDIVLMQHEEQTHHRKLIEAIRKLPFKMRTVLELKYELNFTAAETARVLRMPRTKIHSLIKRAMKLLNKIFLSRRVDRNPRPTRRRIPSHLKCELCDKETTSSKPYCIDHLDKLPEVANIKKAMNNFMQEQQKIAEKGKKAITRKGLLITDIIRELKLGSRTFERLAMDVDLPKTVLAHCIEWLEENNLIKIEISQERKKKTIKLID